MSSGLLDETKEPSPLNEREIRCLKHIQKELGSRFTQIPYDLLVQNIRGFQGSDPNNVDMTDQEIADKCELLIKWRAEMNVDGLMLNPNNDDDEAWQQSYLGESTSGRPVFYQRASSIDPARLSQMPEEAHVRIAARGQELGRVVSMCSSSAHKSRVYKRFILLDFEDFSYMRIMGVRPYAALLGCLSEMYNETAWKIVGVNVPTSIWMILGMAKLLLHPITAEKIVIAPTDRTELFEREGLSNIQIPSRTAKLGLGEQINQLRMGTQPLPFVPPEELAMLESLGININDFSTGFVEELWNQQPTALADPAAAALPAPASSRKQTIGSCCRPSRDMPDTAVPEEVLPSSPVGNATDPIHEAEFPGDPAQMQVQRKYCNAEGCTLQ